MTAGQIVENTGAGVRLRAVPAKPVPRPTRALDLPRLRIVPLAGGMAELRDAAGECFGLFASKQLAASTRDFLSR